MAHKHTKKGPSMRLQIWLPGKAAQIHQAMRERYPHLTDGQIYEMMAERSRSPEAQVLDQFERQLHDLNDMPPKVRELLTHAVAVARQGMHGRDVQFVFSRAGTLEVQA